MNARHSIFEAELQDVIPICHVSIAGTRIIGRLTVGYVISIYAAVLEDQREGSRKERKRLTCTSQQQKRPPPPNHNNRPRTPAHPQYPPGHGQDTAYRRAVIRPGERNLLQ